MTNNIEDIIAKIKKFNLDRDWSQFHDVKNLSMALAAEVGELQEILMWTDSKDVTETLSRKKDKITEEIADIGIYLLLLTEIADIDLLDEIDKKIDRNSIKYPVDKAKGNSKKYNEL